LIAASPGITSFPTGASPAAPSRLALRGCPTVFLVIHASLFHSMFGLFFQPDSGLSPIDSFKYMIFFPTIEKELT
jgi:hypothetical protein